MAGSPEKFTDRITVKRPCVLEVERILAAHEKHPKGVSIIYLSPPIEPGQSSTVRIVDPAKKVGGNFERREFINSDKGSLYKLPGCLVVTSKA
jgi:hypothetical protein